MENPLPHKISELFSKAEDNAAGCHTHEVALNIKQTKETDLNGALTVARAAESVFQEAQATKLTATQARQTADQNARAFIQACLSVLKPKLGSRWSGLWSAAGFVNGSLAMPRTLAG